jgi:hypothetical protein
MEADHDMLEVHSEPELELIALDAELDTIDELDNIDQLTLRICYIETYNNLNWDYLMHQFQDSNAFIYETSVRLKSTMEVLMEQWKSGLFSLEHYQYIIYNVHNIWTYYKNNYVDTDGLGDLISDMANL